MKYIKALFLFIIIVNGSNLFSQTDVFPKIMYVTSKEGLNQRAQPSISSEKIGTFLFGELVDVIQRGALVTIDGITDYWYRARYWSGVDQRENFCWVFGGYLSEDFPLDAPVVLGKWDNPNREGIGYQFTPYGYYLFYIKETGNATWGTWELNGNIITIILTHRNMGIGLETINETLIATLIINDINNIVLNFSNGEQLRLVRNNITY
jgi:hypothetical protein